MKNYIPCLQHWKDMFAQYNFFNVIEMFPIKDIKYKKLKNKFNV